MTERLFINKEVYRLKKKLWEDLILKRVMVLKKANLMKLRALFFLFPFPIFPISSPVAAVG